MKITNINIYPVVGAKVKAFVEIEFDNSLVVNDLRLIQNKDGGLHLHFPTSQNSYSNRLKYVAFPITRELQSEIETQVVEKYSIIVKQTCGQLDHK